eukprot:TRINITY_DN6090_c0_g1_i1.p1 TRINITY_DN6090_c0_g1~~TRINITY_DN6090_c0_g1_i1.p1  ORF type:complete len:101 (+),score=12.86 TRINITY_DN6090_c0_g1_i1:652-954(+)
MVEQGCRRVVVLHPIVASTRAIFASLARGKVVKGLEQSDCVSNARTKQCHPTAEAIGKKAEGNDYRLSIGPGQKGSGLLRVVRRTWPGRWKDGSGYVRAS